MPMTLKPIIVMLANNVCQCLTKTSVAQGWRPGAVSKCILRKLNRAKLRSAATANDAPMKKSKKKCGDRPTLVISKKEGKYTVDMQVTTENETQCIQHDPLVYSITSANYEEKIKKRQRKAKRLIKNMLNGFDDPFHPEACQDSCLRSYKETVDILDVPEGKGDNCFSDSITEDDESDASSSDVDWEIHFSPPNANVN